MRALIAACLLWTMFIGLLPNARAQVQESPHLRVLGPRDGLPTATVKALARDQAGFLWIATSDGLARHDGQAFRVWRHRGDDPGSLSGNMVQAVHVDAQDRVWVSSEFGGIDMLDARRDRFRHWRRSTHPQMGSDDIFAFASHGDMLWFGTGEAGLYAMSLAGDPSSWTPKRIAGTPSDTILNLEVDRRGRLWIATLEGLAVLENGAIRSVPLPGESPMPFVYSLLVDGERLWAGTANGIFRRDADGAWTRLPYADMFERPNAAAAMARGTDGVLWIGSQRQLWRVANDNDVPRPVTTDPPYQPGSVLALLRQPDGALWVGLPGLGLGYLRSDWRAVAQLRMHAEVPGQQPAAYRTLAPAREGGLWLAATDGHVERVDATGVAERLGEDLRQRLPAGKPVAMVEDDRGQLWIFYGRTGLWRIGTDGQLDNWAAGEGATAVPDLLVATPRGRLWLSVPGIGLEERDLTTGTLLRTLDAKTAGLGDGGIEAMRIGPDGRLWLAGGFGLGWLDEARGKLVQPAALAGSRVFGFDFVDADSLWLHRLDGLAYYLKANGDWREAARAAAGPVLPSLQPGGLVVDARGRVWLSSQRGLYRWDPRRKHLDHVGIEHGISSQEFVDRGLAIDAQGRIGAVAQDGSVLLVDSQQADPPRRTPSLRIDAVDVRRRGEWVAQPLSDALSFGPDEREFRLSGHLLSFDNPAGIRYWSRLQGFDRDWVDQGAQGERVFSGLGPGRYRLTMRAMDAAGNAAPEQVLDFVVRPPWWRTWPALLLAGLLALLGLGGLALDYRRRLRRNHALALAEQERNLAEQASQAKTRFLATLGHEIRTPMTGVLGMAELLQATQLDDRQRGHVDAIFRAGRHLLRLVNDALDLARIEAGKLVLADEPFDLSAVIDEVTGLMSPLAERKGLRMELQHAADAPRWLRGDATRVEQILLNLLGNAIKFTERGEVGLVVTAGQDGGVLLEVHDTGPGLNDEQRQRLFRRFEQAEGARTSARYGGSGLGLAISQELAAAMGGRIDVDSRPGHGTRFRVALPLPAAAPQPLARAGQASRAPAAALELLLVEDDATVAEVVRALLRAQGHGVRHAPHGLAALTEVATHRFDMALLDLDLPGMDGFTLARTLRAGGFTQPLLAVTARADAEAEVLAREAGFDGFVRKPLTSDMLAQAIEAVLPPSAIAMS